MNARRTIRAERDYLLRDAVKASPEKHPYLFRMFRNMKKRNPCGKRLSLMVGKTWSGGIALRGTARAGTILLDQKEISTMNEDELRYLLGHELGHFIMWRDIESLGPSASIGRRPRPLASLLGEISMQIYADLVGISECGSAFVAGSNLSDGDEELHDIYDNPFNPLPEKFYGELELAVRIQAMGILARSEFYYDIIDAPLFTYGKELMSADEYQKHMDHLFDPYMDFSDEQGKVLGEFLGAAMFIAGCRPGLLSWHRELEDLGDYGNVDELLRFASESEAYDRIKALHDSVRSITHPLKHITWNAVTDLAYRDWDDQEASERFDDFISEYMYIEPISA